MINTPPSCSSTLLLSETSTSVLDRSSITMMSFLPITCRVGVEYEGDIKVVPSGSEILNPDTDTQNLLGEQREDQCMKRESKEERRGRTKADGAIVRRLKMVDKDKVFQAASRSLCFEWYK
jgi:hypothetical protein